MTRIISPVARVTVNKTIIWQSGDGILKSVSVELNENQRSSRCSAQMYDPDLLIGAAFQKMSLTTGGIVTPEGLLKETSPTSAPATPSSDPSGTTTSGSSTQNTSFSPQVRAFLDLVSWAEGADYTTIYGNRKFSSFADHPRRRITAGGNTSDAAGRYQFLASTWDEVKKALNLKDFSPASQDLAAVYLIDKKRKALKFVEQGTKGLKQALDLLSYEWASFPPARYPQKTRSFEALTNKYISFLLKYQGQSPSQSAAATQPQASSTADNTKAAPLKDKAEQKPVEQSIKGTEIVIELGYSLDQLVAFNFIHIGTNTSRDALGTTTLEGSMIRWVMSRRTQNTAYTSITLRQLAQMICDRYGLKLDMEGNGPTYQYLDQTSISDYELLLRETRAIGYYIIESGNTLVIKPYRPIFTGFVITRDMVQTIRFTDRASSDRSSTPGTTVSTPATPAAETKTKNDRKTGKPTQTKIEDTTGVGNEQLKPFGVTGSATPQVHGTTILDASITGLPKQEIGAIDLADGSAIAAQLSDEAKRIKGYESTATLVTYPETLTLTPGSIIALDSSVAPDPFNREWRISSVRHTLSTAGMRTELQFYSPQAAKEASGSASTSDTTDAPATEVKPGGFVLPAAGKTGDGINGGGNGHRKHTGVDIANVQGTAIVASAGGTTYKVLGGCSVGDDSCHGGYGNNIVIQHENGYFTRYAHLHEILVTQGQKVKQGQKIGTMGNTGHSTGTHLHFEIRKGGSFTDQAVLFSDVGLTIPQKHNKGFRY